MIKISKFRFIEEEEIDKKWFRLLISVIIGCATLYYWIYIK
jgi:hypothetical protein